MSHSVSDTTHSPTPFSPFSSYSVASGATSDDAPDLGAFTTVFRALNTLHPHLPIHTTNAWNAPSTSSSAMSPSEYDSETTRDSIVWSHRGLRMHAPYSLTESALRSRSAPPSETGSTTSDGLDTTQQEEENEHTSDALEDAEDTLEQPSLGYLDGALEFLAAERARITAQIDAGVRATSSAASDIVLRHAMGARRKRRRRKNRSVHEVSILRRPQNGRDEQTDSAFAEETGTGTDRPRVVNDDTSSGDPSSSSNVKSSSDNVPGTPQIEKTRQRSSTAKPRLQHSKSTPSLRLPLSLPFDARVIQLRALAHKLRLFFPKDAAALTSVLNINLPQATTLVDPRGPVPQSQDTLIHVFIDHSNILIGFIKYLKRHLQPSFRQYKRISHAALALVLERGRPITRRVLVASSPLYQPLEPAQELGYEVRVYVRVPDTIDRAERRHSHTTSTRGHAQRDSNGGTSTESDQSGEGIRVRYREQGVDELLQLKLHQAIADADVVPPGATIVLATGDGNEGQFNEEGFLGVARTALKKGWRVELYAWEGGLSKAWMREFGVGPYKSRFEIHMLDRFAVDMLDIGEVS